MTTFWEMKSPVILQEPGAQETTSPVNGELAIS